MPDNVLNRVQRYDDERKWLRQFVIPEEDRHLFTSANWAGEYRWFRSPNIICLEKVRLVSERESRRAAA